MLCGLEITYQNRLYRSLVIPFIRKADRIICISRHTHKLCLENGCTPDQCTVIPCGLAPGEGAVMNRQAAREEIRARYGIPAEALVLLSVGRMVRRKGVAWFLRQVMPSLENTFLLVAGDGPDKDDIERAAAGLGSVALLGKVDERQLQLLYCGSDAFVMPNIRVAGDVEGFGMVLLEAGHNGLFSFAANIDGIPDAVHDMSNGRLLESDNADVWIRELGSFRKKRTELERLGAQARRYVDDWFLIDTVLYRYRQIWNSLVKDDEMVVEIDTPK
jgi:glycosyltransferase involved in cell wall biosynthesis